MNTGILVKEGRYYRSRSGAVWGPMVDKGDVRWWSWGVPGNDDVVWFDGGYYTLSFRLHPLDLVEEVEIAPVRVTEQPHGRPMPTDYPTLHAIGLGSQLAELERICAESVSGKHAGESILDPGSEHHWLKAAGHLTHDGTLDSRDPETNARHIIHAAARLLMAAACLDAEGETIPLNCTRCEGTGAEPPGCPESGPCEQCRGWTETKRAIARGET